MNSCTVSRLVFAPMTVGFVVAVISHHGWLGWLAAGLTALALGVQALKDARAGRSSCRIEPVSRREGRGRDATPAETPSHSFPSADVLSRPSSRR